MPSNKFENKLRQRFEGAKMTPSPEVWDRISDKIDDSGNRRFFFGIIPFQRGAAPKYAAYLSAAAAAAILLFLAWPKATPDTASQTDQITQQSFEAAPADIIDLEPEINQDAEQVASTQTGQSQVVPAQSGAGNHHAGSASSPSTTSPSNAAPYAATDFEDLPPSHSHTNDVVLAVTTPAPPVAQSTQVETPSAYTPRPWDFTPIQAIESSGLLAETSVDIPADPLPLNGVIFTPKSRKWGFGGSFGQKRQMRNFSVVVAQNLADNNLVLNQVGSPGNSRQDMATPVSSTSNNQVIGTIQYPVTVTGGRFDAEFFLNRSLAVQAGIGYSFHHGKGFAVNQAELDTYGAAPSPTPNSELNFSSINIPVFLNHYLRMGKSAFRTSAGISYQHILNSQRTKSLANPNNFSSGPNSNVALESLTNDQSMVRLNALSLMGRIHYQYQISRRLAIHAGPNLEYGLNSVYNTAPINTRNALALGWEVGVSFFPGG